MKKIIIAMAAIAAAFTMASCNKEPLVEPEKDITPIDGNCIITASTESALTKTALSGSDSEGYEVVWSEGDSFIIGGNTFTLIDGEGTTTGKFQGTLPEDGSYTACYPASYYGADWLYSQTYSESNITDSPMIAFVKIIDGEVAGPLCFQNDGGIFRLTVKGTAKVTSIKVSADELDEAISLDCGDGVILDNTDGKVFHIAIPEGEYSGTSIQFTTARGNYCTKTLKAGKSLVINKSEITPATFTASFTSSGSNDPLIGEFSVAADKQVSFSRGNLYYDGGFNFETKQYGFHASDFRTNTWGLFGWSTSTSGTATTDNYGMSASESTNYSGDFYDWGKAIGDGNTWRTLTSDEWTYLFETRTNATEKYGYATVGGQKGLIILPDEFTDPMKNGGSGAFKPQTLTGSKNWSNNDYTIGGNWESMETAGAVFLPAANRRIGEETKNEDSGLYWSSSACDDASKANFLFFNIYSFNPDEQANRYEGHSVRLVTDLYTVTFDMNGKDGTAPESFKEIAHGSKITKPSNPSVICYKFAGWYKDESCTKTWNFESDVVTSNLTLYANWVKIGEGYAEVKAEAGISDNKVKWIQLWEGGPKFAEFNIGAKSVTENGGYYCWGSTINNDANQDYWKGDNINGHDTATLLWGSNWRMPTLAEFQALLSNCTCSYVGNYNGTNRDGLLCTGKGNYSSNCVFLPTAGSNDGGSAYDVNRKGRYWSSTPDSDGMIAYDLQFGLSDQPTTGGSGRLRGFSVRAVLAK